MELAVSPELDPEVENWLGCPSEQGFTTHKSTNLGRISYVQCVVLVLCPAGTNLTGSWGHTPGAEYSIALPQLQYSLAPLPSLKPDASATSPFARQVGQFQGS